MSKKDHHAPAFTIDVADVEALSTEELAQRVAAEQKAKVGSTYAYCGTCGLPVSKSAAYNAARR